MRSEDEAVEALRRVHREASDRLDEAPDPGVRAAVLAAAARGVDARPHLANTVSDRASRRALPARHWPWSAAALLVVSVMTGLVVTHVLRDAPEPVTTIAAAEQKPDVPAASAPVEPMASVTPPPAPATPPPKRMIAQREAPADVAPRHADRATEPATRFTEPPLALAIAPPPPAPVQEARAKAESSSEASTRAASVADAVSLLQATTATRARIARTIEPATPEAWVARIVQLRADGNDVEADREVDGLRQRYPDFPIPAKVLRQAGTR